MAATAKIIIKLFILYACIALSPMMNWGTDNIRQAVSEYYEENNVHSLRDASDEDLAELNSSYLDGFK